MDIFIHKGVQIGFQMKMTIVDSGHIYDSSSLTVLPLGNISVTLSQCIYIAKTYEENVIVDFEILGAIEKKCKIIFGEKTTLKQSEILFITHIPH